jgi:hypothetical protein
MFHVATVFTGGGGFCVRPVTPKVLELKKNLKNKLFHKNHISFKIIFR